MLTTQKSVVNAVSEETDTSGILHFSHARFETLRDVEIAGNPWLVGKDVAIALGYTNPSKAITDHVEPEDKGVTKCYTPGGEQEIVVINESGFYFMIFGSKLPAAKSFKQWVTNSDSL